VATNHQAQLLLFDLRFGMLFAMAEQTNGFAQIKEENKDCAFTLISFLVKALA
jgi:hypothetical protein